MYEFSLDEEFGPFQDESYFEMVAPGVHILYVKDKNNCGVANLEISVVGFPKFFTPNNDGINDFFFVNERLLYDPIHLIVYNRWGMKIFEDFEYLNNWDGDNSVGKPLVNGTYYYVLKLTGADDRAGFVMIIR